MPEKRSYFPSIEPEVLNFGKMQDKNGVWGLEADVISAYDSKILGRVFMDREAYQQTLGTGFLVAWSRDRSEYWFKGATSGNVVRIEEIITDCDQDTLNIFVTEYDPFCHLGRRSCFDKGGDDI